MVIGCWTLVYAWAIIIFLAAKKIFQGVREAARRRIGLAAMHEAWRPVIQVGSVFGGQEMIDVVVVGAGPAGVVAARRAAELGARTVLVTRDAFGGMAANDGPIPVRTLAQAARLLREARQLGRYRHRCKRAQYLSIPDCSHACERSSTTCERIPSAATSWTMRA